MMDRNRWKDKNGRAFDVGSKMRHPIGTVLGVDGQYLLIGNPKGSNPMKIKKSDVGKLEAEA